MQDLARGSEVRRSDWQRPIATTIRTYDRRLQAWRVNFINPAAQETSAQLIARRKEQGIEMEGKLSDDTPIRWRYVTVEPTFIVPLKRGTATILDNSIWSYSGSD
jgi:hypothetical protein